ncbi:MAG: 3-phosphoshikimate 1-carboxyvinyltransferase, partial [Deltaproteobacteria bacterium GWA2_50_8]
DLYCGNSGTTLRLMTGLLSAQGFDSRLTGDDSLDKRPMDRIMRPLSQMGARIKEERQGGKRFVVIKGQKNPLTPIYYESPVSSAQVKSAILLAGLYVSGATTVKEPLPSRDHTEKMMQSLGLDCQVRGSEATLKSTTPWEGREFVIPGDFSSAAFPLVATLIHPHSSAKVILRHVGVNPTRLGLWDVLKSMGAHLKMRYHHKGPGEPVADIEVIPSKMQGIRLDKNHIPRLIDEIPILTVAAASAQGETQIRGAEELRVKETDRLRALAHEFKKLKIPIVEHPDGLDITGSTNWRGAHCSSHGDHRIAMSLAVAGMIAEGTVRIEDVACIQTSFPNFYTLMKSLGAVMEEKVE